MFSERSVRLMYSTHALQCNSIFAILKGEVRAADGDATHGVIRPKREPGDRPVDELDLRPRLADQFPHERLQDPSRAVECEKGVDKRLGQTNHVAIDARVGVRRKNPSNRC